MNFVAICALRVKQNESPSINEVEKTQRILLQMQ